MLRIFRKRMNKNSSIYIQDIDVIYWQLSILSYISHLLNMKIKRFVLIIFYSFFCILTFSQEVLDTTKCVMFLNNKRVYAKEIEKGFQNGTIIYYSGESSVRSILLKYGEKYRNFGVYFFITRKKDEND